ncbi:DUF1963 domain-containing protein [Blastococcus goldschmidtiae]|uniref:DUF1963 domain-containing protein n=1 Tax=Blastococcus goldschmidtiae TaxID=3075546 RepID=A0ABU2KE50_9ACTN|nr:DUF1963 domain-containing protein [Blastococcus sp. DSM 46792]MDT0278461.1 DUF1963 domain-containing protein [Blastococcus sp. DSM 46792]
MDDRGQQLLAELTAGLEQLVAWEDAVPGVGFRVWNRQTDRNTAVVDALLRQPDGWPALQRLAVQHPDPGVRGYAESYVNPGPPDTVGEAREWLAHPARRLGHLDLAVEPCVYSAAQDEETSRGLDTGLAEWPHGSWVRGSSTSPGPWPLRDDGIPLVHVAHLDLHMLTWLPAHPFPDVTGAFEVFHDLETWGIEESDGPRNCWALRVIPYGGRLAGPPSDLDVSPAAWLHGNPGVSLAWPDDWVDRLSEAEVDALTDAQDAIRDQVLDTVGPAPRLPPGAARFVPQVLGHPQLGWGNVVQESLEPFLPLSEEGDRWVFLLDVPGVGPLDGWFGDEGHLEVWIRASDLAAGAYESCWMTVRNQ